MFLSQLDYLFLILLHCLRHFASKIAQGGGDAPLAFTALEMFIKNENAKRASISFSFFSIICGYVRRMCICVFGDVIVRASG